MPARDGQGLAVDEAVGEFKSGIFVNFRYRCPGNLHLRRALFMGSLFVIDQPDHFVLIHGENHLAGAFLLSGNKAPATRFRADAAATTWSGHTSTSSSNTDI